MDSHVKGSFLLAMIALLLYSCSEAPPLERTLERQKLSLSGTFLTESPDEINFPVKILFAIDCSLSMGDDVGGVVAGSDPYDLRIEAVRNFIQAYNTSEYPNVSFEIMLWNNDVFAQTRNGANQAGFTRDTYELNRVLDSAHNDTLTDYLGALDNIRADLENDIYLASAEEGGDDNMVRTKYIVIFLSDGMPNVQGGTQPNNDIWQKIDDLIEMTESYGVGSFNFHTFLLLAGFGPTASGQAARQQATTTLQGMAQRGDGLFREFETAESIDFINITDMRLTTEYKIKYLVAFNYNVLPGTDLIYVDSDGDGLSDEEEAVYGSDINLTDTDNDGLSDFFEVAVSSPGHLLIPIVADSPCQPTPDGIWVDSDSDGLTDCEEYVKGTQRYVTDTDRDGIPDGLEFVMGTNPLKDESNRDADFDGVQDWLEVQKHSNVTTNDPIVRDRYSYIYYVEDKGLVPINQGSDLPSYVREYEFKISNIDVMDTQEYSVNNQIVQSAGDNFLRIYVAQVPEDMPNTAPVFRMAEIRVNTFDADRDIAINPYDFELLQ